MGLSLFQKLIKETMGSINPSGSARIAGSRVAEVREALALPSGPIIRRLEATWYTGASPFPMCVKGTATEIDF